MNYSRCWTVENDCPKCKLVPQLNTEPMPPISRVHIIFPMTEGTPGPYTNAPKEASTTLHGYVCVLFSFYMIFLHIQCPLWVMSCAFLQAHRVCVTPWKYVLLYNTRWNVNVQSRLSVSKLPCFSVIKILGKIFNFCLILPIYKVEIIAAYLIKFPED